MKHLTTILLLTTLLMIAAHTPLQAQKQIYILLGRAEGFSMTVLKRLCKRIKI